MALENETNVTEMIEMTNLEVDSKTESVVHVNAY